MPDAQRAEIAKLEALYADHPEGRLFTHLAEAYRKAGELERAREVLRDGIGRHPDYSSAHVVLGRVLMDQGHAQEAEREFQRVLELDAHNLVALRSLGDLARADGRTSAAVDFYSRLLDVEPSDEEVRDRVASLTRTPAVGPERSEAAESRDVTETAEQAAEPVEPSGAADEETDDFAGREIFEPYEAEPSVAEAEQPGAAGGWRDSAEVEEAASPERFRATPEEESPEGFRATAEEELEAEPADGSREQEPVSTADRFDAGWSWGAVELPEEDEDEVAPAPGIGEPGVNTETIAGVYARQGLYDRAAEVYRQLLRERPDDAALRDRLAEMESLAAEQGGIPEAEPGAAGAQPARGAETEEEPASEARVEEAPAPEGFVAADFDSAAGVEPLPGLEPEETGPTPTREESWEWAGEEPSEAESVESVWTGAEGATSNEETPYAWAEPEAEPDESAPIADYMRGLLGWPPPGGAPGQSQGAGEAAPRGPAGQGGGGPLGAGQPGPGQAGAAEREVDAGDDGSDDDDDLDMFRSWLESLKQ